MKESDSSQIIPITPDQVSDPHAIQRLLDIIDKMANKLALQEELIQRLRDEIALLKGQKPRPQIPPSTLEGPRKVDWRKRFSTGGKGEPLSFSLWTDLPIGFQIWSLTGHQVVSFLPLALQGAAEKLARCAHRMIKLANRGRKPGQPRGKARRKKKTLLPIHATEFIQPVQIPSEAIFKGWKPYTVQELVVETRNTRYQLGRWQMPDGSYIAGELPAGIQGHYGPKLRAYVLHQYHACRVPEHLILEQLHAFGALISIGQVNNILLEEKEELIAEIEEVLPVAARIEGEIQVDDTGGRHKGQNQYTTVIGNACFSLFVTRESKSRVNFLKLLQRGKEEYVINEDAVDYLEKANVSSHLPGYVGLSRGMKFATLAEWELFLKQRNIVSATEVRFVTEAALYASVIEHGIPKDLGVHADDAGQFDLFVRSLCWIHEERHYRKLMMVTEESRAELKWVVGKIWEIYRALKEYKEAPSEEAKEKIEKEFDTVFKRQTSSPTLNDRLAKTYAKRTELLRVLERPATSLHNNGSETCARAAKIKLKISGGTRSDLGRKTRDIFLSVKQTCLKLGINFWDFLCDRVRGAYLIPRLAKIICERALEAATDPPLSEGTLVKDLLRPDCEQLIS